MGRSSRASTMRKMLAATRADFEAVQGAAGPVLERCRSLAGPEPSAAAASPVSDAARRRSRSRRHRPGELLGGR